MRGWRPLTWFILVVNVLFLIWMISLGGAAAENCDDVTRAEMDACEAGTAIGATLGAGLIIFLWVAADVILGIVWLVTNRGRRDCPVCGRPVKKGQTECKSCGYDFKTGSSPTAQAQA
jgi:hypothetical protein